MEVTNINDTKRNRNCNKPYSSKDKWVISIIVGLLFLLVASPYFFKIMNNGFSSFGLTTATSNGYPNMAGLILHAILFMIIIRILMG